MRPLSPVWLALSLAANAVLVVVCLTRGAGESREEGDAVALVGHTEAKTAGGVDVSGLTPHVVEKISAGDEATLRDLLLACGMEPKAVRRIGDGRSG